MNNPSPSTRRPTNVTLPANLLAEARTLGVNISRACETGLQAEIARTRAERWVAQNPGASAMSDEVVAHRSTRLPSEVVRAGLEALESRDRAIEGWLRDEIAPAFDRVTADPSRALSSDAVVAALRSHHEKHQKPSD